MLGDELACHRLGSPRGIRIAFRGSDDRALHQDVPGLRELARPRQAGFHGQLAHQGADRAQMIDAGLSEPMGGTHLQHDVDERARLEVIAVEPFVEHVEDGQQPPLRGSRAAGTGLHRRERPDRLAALQEGKCEVVLGREVLVEGRLGDLGTGDDLVHPDVADATPGE